jgi:hypothetical protein
MKKVLSQIPFLDTLFIIIVGGVLSYELLFRDLQTFIYLSAGLLTALVLNFIPEKKGLVKTLLCITAPIAVVVLNQNTFHLSLTYLVGINFATLYFQIKHFEDKFFNNHLINIILISNLIFLDSLSKFRGFNKLDIENVSLSIIAAIIFNLIVFVACAMFNMVAINNLKKHSEESIRALKVFFPLIILITGYLYASQMFFKEIGIELIFMPLICGAVAATGNQLLKPNSFINNIMDVCLLIILPFRISGFVGITLAMLTAILFIEMTKRLIFQEESSARENIYKYFPLSFIFALTEIRENQGIITRFNLVSGYQLGWILIGIITSVYSYKYLQKLREFLVENEILKTFALVGSLFTIAIFTIIINLGRDEGIISLTLSSVIYLVLLSVLDYEKHKKEIRIANSVATCIGVLSFLILTKL